MKKQSKTKRRIKIKTKIRKNVEKIEPEK